MKTTSDAEGSGQRERAPHLAWSARLRKWGSAGLRCVSLFATVSRWSAQRQPRTDPGAAARVQAMLGSVGSAVRQFSRALAARALTVPVLGTARVDAERRRLVSSVSQLGRDETAQRPAQVRIIANPVSGGPHTDAWVKELEATARWLTVRGRPTEVCLTDGPGSARGLADEAVRAGLPVVVAAGGDGTINEVIQALAGHTTALGVLPTGTINVWAREMGIPLSLVEARAVLREGVHRRIDLGRAGTRYFLLMAGIGIDAEATRRVERQGLARVGLKLLDYIAIGGYLSVTQRPQRVWIHQGGKRRGTHIIEIVIGNTRLWGGAFTFTQRAIADDGWLDIVYVGGHRLRDRAQVFIRAALRLPSLGPHARYERVRSLRLDADKPLPVQVDGEVIGHLPMTFAVCPRALTVIVPKASAPDLFLHPPLPSS
ncbi:MAG TPA: diacylglycerol kinase family protein [Ktedonobacterales bacterium]